jgi:hypothetical protein
MCLFKKLFIISQSVSQPVSQRSFLPLTYIVQQVFVCRSRWWWWCSRLLEKLEGGQSNGDNGTLVCVCAWPHFARGADAVQLCRPLEVLERTEGEMRTLERPKI